MKNTITPLGENVLIKPEKAAKKTKTGIYLPDSASEEKPQEGIVIAVGTGKSIAVKKNQHVLFRRFSGTPVTVEGIEYLILKGEDILAIIGK